MQLDTNTLIVGGIFIAMLSGVLLIAARTQIAGDSGLLWWGAADLAYAAGVSLSAFHGVVRGQPMEQAGLVLMAAAPALVWLGVRRFNHHRERRDAVIAIGACLLTALGGAYAHENGSTVVSFAAWVVFLGAATFELWRSRTEPLSARWPLGGLFLLNALVYAVGIVDILTGVFGNGQAPRPTSGFGVIYFEGLVYLVGTSVFMVLLCKERLARRQVMAARKDSLTGTANRGAFTEAAQRLLQRAHSEGASFSLIMFDLDEFKSVNDAFGHDVGDAVIRTFVEIARAMLRPTDLIGRYGGEEFVVALPRATIEAAYVIAERIRYGFSQSGIVAEDKPVPTTVSGGVASAIVGTSIDAIIRAADRALYRAKRLGRNRIERTRDDPESGETNVVRVA
jgi:diguanylate cyclase (GGDEF)-like protein